MNAALDTLSDSLAARGDWIRMLRVLSLIDPRNSAAIVSSTSDTAASVRSFLAGKNFELAEQWEDAAAAYKTVLRTAAPRSPITEAAVRLKELGNKHLVHTP